MLCHRNGCPLPWHHKKLLPPQHANQLSSAQVLFKHIPLGSNTQQQGVPLKETQSLPQAGGDRAAERSVPAHPGRPGSARAAAASPPQEIVENSFSSSSWLSVLKARFFLTLMLMERT